jgi:hypothetical protein
MCDTILYTEGETSEKIYLVLSGILILHNVRRGAIGIVTLENTCGEEVWGTGENKKLEYAVAQ